MIGEQLDSVLKDMDSYHKQIGRKSDAEKRIQDNKEFSGKVDAVALHVQKIDQTKKQLQYKPDDETLNDLEMIINSLEDCVSLGNVDEDILSKTTNSMKKLDASLSTSWQSFYKKSLKAANGRADLVIGIVKDKEKYRKIKNRMSTAGDWTSLHLADGKGKTRLDNYSEGNEEIQKAVKSLNLNAQITQFLTKVNDGKATMNDLTDEVIKWIKDQKYEKLFKIHFES